MFITFEMQLHFIVEKICTPCVLQSVNGRHILNRTYASAVVFNELRKDTAPVRPKPQAKISRCNLLIECKRPQYNFVKNQGTSNSILASHGWTNRKSNGDYFTIHPYEKHKIVNSEGTFQDMNLHPKILEWLHANKLKNPTEIQAASVEPILEGHNVLLAAETGCGKTLAYLLPMVKQLQDWKPYMPDTLNAPLGLIITPSRELAIQIANIANALTEELKLSTKVLLGGGLKSKMLHPTFENIDLLVATMGALSKLTTTNIINLSRVRHVVLDEADTLLDDSFSDKIKRFLLKVPFHYRCIREAGKEPKGAQLTLASATIPRDVGPIFDGIITEESVVHIKTSGLHQLLPCITQKFQRIGRKHRPEELLKVAKAACASKAPLLIFSNTSATSDWISLFLNSSGVQCVNLNGDMSRHIRHGKFQQFQDGLVDILSTTDIGSRGLDTTRAEIVLNFDFPVYIADYIHRCGRIGRIGSLKSGKVINFVCGPMEAKLVQVIEQAARDHTSLPQVNANITRIIENKAIHRINREMKLR